MQELRDGDVRDKVVDLGSDEDDPLVEQTAVDVELALAAGGALLALAGTLPLVLLAWHGLVAAVLTASLFVRGVGVSAIGVPSITSGYASVARQDLPMATTAMNIMQRLGGPASTTLCAAFLAWRLSARPGPASAPGAYAAAFCLLCALHALLFLATLRLPRRVPRAAPASPAAATAPRPA